MEITNEDFKAGEVDRFTVVIWLEGWDPECVNDIMEGRFTLSMNFNVLTDGTDSGNPLMGETDSPFRVLRRTVSQQGIPSTLWIYF
jgi:hypothetical protein